MTGQPLYVGIVWLMRAIMHGLGLLTLSVSAGHPRDFKEPRDSEVPSQITKIVHILLLFIQQLGPTGYSVIMF
jgi:hypothetical protein